MDTFGTIVAILGVLFLLKGVLGSLRAGIREGQRRLKTHDRGNQVTAPARQLDREQRRLPYQSTVFGLVGFAAIAIVAVRLFLPASLPAGLRPSGTSPTRADTSADSPGPSLA